ncbi:MAG: hypothetical protein K0S63_834 [Gammaproteobacteria bacterium]|nr:hypothetical protein [Gammaproteobacteria bacterium]
MESTVMIDTRSTMNNIEPLKKTGLGERLKTAREALQLTEKDARLLNFPEDEITLLLQDLEVAMPPSNTITSPTPSVNHRNGRYLHGLTCLIIVILCVLVSLWWHSHSHYIINSAPTTEVPQAITTMETSPPVTTITPLVAAPTHSAHEKLQTPAATASEESDNQDEN